MRPSQRHGRRDVGVAVGLDARREPTPPAESAAGSPSLTAGGRAKNRRAAARSSVPQTGIHAVPRDQQETCLLQGLVDRGRRPATAESTVGITPPPFSSGASPMSSSQSSGRAAMKSGISATHRSSSSTVTCDTVLGEPVVPPVERVGLPHDHAPIPNWRTSPLQYQHGERVVTMIVLR